MFSCGKSVKNPATMMDRHNENEKCEIFSEIFRVHEKRGVGERDETFSIMRNGRYKDALSLEKVS
jgi:hypothetical protein